MARILFLLSFLLVLVGCTNSVSDSIVKATQDSVIALQKSLPSECKSESINAQIKAINSQIEAFKPSCDVQVDKVTAEKRVWQIGCFALLLLIIAYIWSKLKK